MDVVTESVARQIPSCLFQLTPDPARFRFHQHIFPAPACVLLWGIPQTSPTKGLSNTDGSGPGGISGEEYTEKKEAVMSRLCSGGRACGAIRCECPADPVFSWSCHCRNCQRANGSAFYPVPMRFHGRALQHRSGPLSRREDRKRTDRTSWLLPAVRLTDLYPGAEIVPNLIGVWAASRD